MTGIELLLLCVVIGDWDTRSELREINAKLTKLQPEPTQEPTELRNPPVLFHRLSDEELRQEKVEMAAYAKKNSEMFAMGYGVY